MRKIIYLSILLFTNFTYSQGNLQFNRVITFTPGSNYTVPTGKVLKIESINISSTSVCIPRTSSQTQTCQPAYGQAYNNTYGIYDGITFLTLNNINYVTPSFSGFVGGAYQCSNWSNADCWNYTFSNMSFNCPIWLEAGKRVYIHSGVASILISAIEFNIIP